MWRRKFSRRRDTTAATAANQITCALIAAQVIDCVRRRTCVAPNGADQSNHRFDQSVFSIVLARMHIRCHNNWKFNGYLEDDRLHEARDSAAAPACRLRLHGIEYKAKL